MSAATQQTSTAEDPYGEGFFSVFKPTPDLTIDQWADRYRFLPKEGSAETGIWVTDRAPYLRPIMQAMSPSSPIREIVICKSVQMGATEVILNAIMFYIDMAPGPILAFMPTVDLVNEWESQRIKPSFDKCPRILSKLRKNTIENKTFIGGTALVLHGMHSANAVSSMPAKYVFMDELDRYPLVLPKEGAPEALAEMRTATFSDAKIIYASTPTQLKTSRIWDKYLNSTQSVFTVPCPHCGGYQALVWERMHWEPGKPETAWYECGHCGGEIKERHKTEMFSKIRVLDTNPGHYRKGFHISRLYAPVGWLSWVECARKYDDARDDPEKMRLFYNLYLGLPFDDGGDHVDHESLQVEDYGYEVPEGVLILTLAVDVQSSPARLEYEVRGWGDKEESWGIKYGVIMGDPGIIKGTPEMPSVWEALDQLREKIFRQRDGSELRIGVTNVDSGGHYTDIVYRYCKDRESLRVFAIQGSPIYERAIVSQPNRNNRAKAILFKVGVSQAKSLIYQRLRLAANPSEPVPGFCHFPSDPQAGYNEQYFAGLTCERLKTKYVNGYKKLLWEKPSMAHNEPLDLFVYGLHALRIFQPDWKKIRERIEHVKKWKAEKRAEAEHKPATIAEAQEQRDRQELQINDKNAVQKDSVSSLRNFLGRL